MAAVLGLVMVAAGGGWVAGSRIQSPAERAARTAAPDASPILVPAEERVLSTDIVTRGTGRFGSPQTVSIAPSALKANAGVITTVPMPGTQLNEGNIVMSASGRPVFVIEGTVPSYRDLGQGAAGDDVRQVEAALQRMGFDPGPADGTYDERTAAAVGAWYRSSGWKPFEATADQLAAIRALERELTKADNDLLAADGTISSAQADLAAARAASASAIAAATAGPSASAAGATAQADLAAARAAYANALAAAAAAPDAVKAARAEADASNKAAAADVAAKTLLRDQVFADPASTSAERAATEADLATAQAAQTTARLAGEAAIRNAVDAQAAAEREVEATGAQVAGAEQALAAARLADEAASRAAIDAQAAAAREAEVTRARVASAEQSLNSAQSQRANLADSVAQLGADLWLARLQAGVQLPADEVVVVTAVPARVEAVKVSPGDPASGPMMTVTNSQIVVDSSLALDEAALVRPGMRVTIDEPALGIATTGVVGRVADAPGTNGADGFHRYFDVLVEGTSSSLVGASVRLTVPVESTGGAVLAVPVSALSLAVDGTSRIQVQNKGILEYIVVKPGLSAKGFVEVTVVSGTLTPGQLIVIGFGSTKGAPGG